jgi:hypothetical protein
VLKGACASFGIACGILRCRWCQVMGDSYVHAVKPSYCINLVGQKQIWFLVCIHSDV